MLHVVSIFDARKAEIIDWLIRESGRVDPIGSVSVLIALMN